MNNMSYLTENGFIKYSNLIERDLIDRAIAAIDNRQADLDNKDVLVTTNNTVRKICYAFEKDSVFLDILSHPKVIRLLKTIYKEDISSILPSWEDILIKQPVRGIPVEIHQDLGLQSVKLGDVYSLAFHFHDAIDNPVSFLKGSHELGALTRDEIKKYQDKEKYTPSYCYAGDVNVHNVLTLHYSDSNSTQNPRYTWYLEFRTIEQIVNDSQWDEEWALRRQAIFFHAIQKRKKEGLDYEEINFAREKDFLKYLDDLNLRIPHETSKVKYTDNEYNHFADHKHLF